MTFVAPYSSSLHEWQRQVSNSLNPLFAKFDAHETIKTYNAAGDGSTDDTKALTAFWNHAIANPGVPHLLDAKVYCVSAPLPTINVSNVIIRGCGVDLHDAGSLLSGPVLKYIGSSAPSSTLIQASAVSGASNQRLANIEISGIGIDCNYGLVGRGLGLYSVRSSIIDMAIANASDRGVDVNVVASLGEAKDVQDNRFRFRLRQLETPGGLGIVLGGDSVANVSMNEFWIDAQHKNSAVLQCANSDNNIYRSFRATRGTGGTATESASLFGGANSSQCCRDERFDFYSATVGAHVYGTGSYASPSIGHNFHLDVGNGTPVPAVDTGATASWRGDYADFGTGTAITATAGTNGAIPAQVAGYMVMNVNGASVKVPYFNT